MMITARIKSITTAATERAKAADTNNQRCLIENCSSKRAIQVTHAFNRENAVLERKMAAIEWNTNMQKFTMNLDTRRNVFMVGASIGLLYEQKRWGLVPEEDVVDRYFNEDGNVRPRQDFPELTEETFTYSFVPLQRMEEVYITRQTDLPTGGRKIDIYHFPHDGFPKVTSHVDPKFAILQIGSILTMLEEDKRLALIKKHPIMEKICTLHRHWCKTMAVNAHSDPTYVVPVPEDERFDDWFSETSSAGNSTSTPKRRIWARAVPENADEAVEEIAPANVQVEAPVAVEVPNVEPEMDAPNETEEKSAHKPEVPPPTVLAGPEETSAKTVAAAPSVPLPTAAEGSTDAVKRAQPGRSAKNKRAAEGEPENAPAKTKARGRGKAAAATKALEGENAPPAPAAATKKTKRSRRR
ncbi:hypothetical protein CVT24_008527 [Panaeolus cyanescens]|uniref:Uncharacterized protein n=1 Tax=Panaeolus cyanescens TaxID=181874 RepID=A0A409VKX4_9AGAR|nr:hypothetical protein CVT24_008527 [Panaeolus cyanescens]